MNRKWNDHSIVADNFGYDAERGNLREILQGTRLFYS